MKRYLHCLYETLIALPLSCAILYLSYRPLGLTKVSAPAVLLLVYGCILCLLVEYLTGKDRLLVLGSAAILAVLPLLYAQLAKSPRFLVGHRYLWLTPLLSIICYLICVGCKKSRVPRYLVIVSVLSCLFVYRYLNIEIQKTAVMLFGTVLLLLLIEETQRLWHKEGYTEHTAHLVSVAPFVAVYLLIALQLPTRTSPFEWNFVKDFITRIEDLTTSIVQRIGRGSEGDDFYAYIPGFSDGNAKIGGDVTTDDNLVLQLEVFPSSITSVYLAGETKDTFSALSWKRTISTADNEYEFDMLETRCAFLRDPSSMDYLRDFSLRMQYRNLSTRYLFTPERSIVNWDALAELGVTEKGHSLQFDRKRGINTAYSIEGFQLNVLHPAFAEYVNRYTPFTEEEWGRMVRRSKRNQLIYTYEALLTYRERMKTLYHHDITLSEPVQHYIDTIKGDAKSSYDTMLRLRQALSSFTYTKTPGNLPEGVTDADSYLHYFFSTQKGYCSYFATAMVLLAWNEGLPARYVSGFLAPIGSQKLSDVTGSMAHAWCEIYFEGLGWIPFDATPGYGSSVYWATREEAAAADRPIINRPDNTPTPTPPPALAPIPAEEPETGAGADIALLIAIAVLALLFLTAAVLIGDRIYTNHRFEMSSPAEQIITLYRRNTHILSLLKLPIQEGETLLEYRRRLEAAEPKLDLSWLRLYEDFLYGSVADTAPELIEAHNKKALPAMKRGNALLLSVFRKRMPRHYAICRLFNRLLR